MSSRGSLANNSDWSANSLDSLANTSDWSVNNLDSRASCSAMLANRSATSVSNSAMHHRPGTSDTGSYSARDFRGFLAAANTPNTPVTNPKRPMLPTARNTHRRGSFHFPMSVTCSKHRNPVSNPFDSMVSFADSCSALLHFRKTFPRLPSLQPPLPWEFLFQLCTFPHPIKDRNNLRNKKVVNFLSSLRLKIIPQPIYINFQHGMKKKKKLSIFSPVPILGNCPMIIFSETPLMGSTSA